MRIRAGAVAMTLAAALTLTAVATPAAPKKKKKRHTPTVKLVPNTKLTGATVYGAASLSTAFPAMAPKLTYSFAGSDQLALQIQQGAPADVFASANVKYPNQLFKAGLVQEPRIFAYNVLVVLVPKANPAHITSVNDLARPGVKLVIGDPTVPVGSYTRTVLHKLNLDAALNNVVSNEPDVNGVVTKVALGEADAGVAYWTDFLARRKQVTSIAIPAEAQPTVAYSVAVPTNAPHASQGQAVVNYLMSPAGQRWLVHYGFRPAAPTK